MISVGLMSGTSLDGIDAAILETDGENIFFIGPSTCIPYTKEFRAKIRAVTGQYNEVNKELERELTFRHAEAVHSILNIAGLSISKIDVVGFHGQTIFHAPSKNITCQIGDGKLLAQTLGVSVVNDFRTTDVSNGGEGAPLAPIYHVALSKPLDRPIAILNLGGVANVTWIGSDEDFLAFDVGPGNALLDDWVIQHGLGTMDEGGKLARHGKVNNQALTQLMSDPYFGKGVPKSLDRDYFPITPLRGLNLKDGAATLTAFTVKGVVKSQNYFAREPSRWLVSGGGRHNIELMESLRKGLGNIVEPVESVGWDGDGLEAQAFAFLAVRSLFNLPISFPTTTGIREATTGGVCHIPMRI